MGVRGGAHTGFWWGNVRERDHLEGLGVDGKIILKYNFNKQYAIAWTDLAGVRDRWRAPVNAVMNIQVT
jgi:hypothetical protein